MRSATRTAAAAIDTACAPISVVLRTSLATAKVRWNRWLSSRPMLPASRASFSASFIWPRICGSPEHHRVQAARDAERVAHGASLCGST